MKKGELMTHWNPAELVFLYDYRDSAVAYLSRILGKSPGSIRYRLKKDKEMLKIWGEKFGEAKKTRCKR